MNARNSLATRLAMSALLLLALAAVALTTPQPAHAHPRAGCTPGYWKQEQHFDSWAATGYAPDQLFADVFGVSIISPTLTLQQALEAKGGGIHALARHTVAALLNAQHPEVNYPTYPGAYVIALFNEAYGFGSGSYEKVKNLFEASNELGCPLS